MNDPVILPPTDIGSNDNDDMNEPAVVEDYLGSNPPPRNGILTVREDQLAIAHLKRAARTNPLHFKQLIN